MNATIRYTLTPAGQKASLFAGGDGKREQAITVSQDAPEFRRCVEIGEVRADGSVTVDATVIDRNHASYYYREDVSFNGPATAAEVLDTLVSKRASLAAKIATEESEAKARREREDAEDRAAIEAWAAKPVAERIGQTGGIYCTLGLHRGTLGLHRGSSIPDDHPALIECKAELERQQAVAAAAKEARRLEAERAEDERRAALGLAEDEMDLAVEDGALIEVPPNCWESHSRGKNWCANIAADPSAPGGLARDFWTKAKGASYYHVPAALKPGDAVEFGADYYSGRGRKNARRWYGYVTRVEPGMVVLVQRAGGKTAIKAGQKFAETHQPVPTEIDAALARVNGEGAIISAPSQN
jgi:hypothetical protein